jgi:hypothetical protein
MKRENVEWDVQFQEFKSCNILFMYHEILHRVGVIDHSCYKMPHMSDFLTHHDHVQELIRINASNRQCRMLCFKVSEPACSG